MRRADRPAITQWPGQGVVVYAGQAGQPFALVAVADDVGETLVPAYPLWTVLDRVANR